MVPKRLSASVSVGGQITRADVDTLAELGFKTIVCHRPDGEADDQATFAEIAAAAQAHNIDARHQPVRMGHVGVSDADEFARILNGVAKPVFAYCRSGRRCTELWQLMQDRDTATKRLLREHASATA